jgi:hypothetical protein
VIEILLAIAFTVPLTVNAEPFHGDTYTVTESSILDSDGNVTEWLPEMYEDMPGWDCKTMGNRMCGFQAPISGEWYTVQY